MNFIKSILLFLFQFFLWIACFAQDQQYRAVLWGMNDGLSMEGANHMIKDKNGFLWVSSRMGINRFDGNTFKSFAEVSGFTAFGLIEDSLHNIWIGANEGVYRYDISADTFSNFKMLPDSLNSNQRSFPIWATKEEVFVIHEKSKTIYAINIRSLVKRILVKLADADNIFNIIYIEKTNNLWIPDGGGQKADGGLLSISVPTGERTFYHWPCYKKIPQNSHLALMSGHSHRAQSMCFDRKRNCLWLNTMDGLMEFTLEDEQFHHIDAFNDWVLQRDYNFIETGGITLDLLNRVWVSTFPRGIFIYDPATRSASLPFHDSLIQDNVSRMNLDLYADRDSMIWLSYAGPKGVYQVIPSSAVVTHYSKKIFDVGGRKQEMVIQNFIPADQGKIWIGSGWQGLYSFDPENGSVTLIRKDIEPGVHLDSQFPMMIDTLKKKAWIGVERRGRPWGIFEMDMTTLQYRPLIFQDTSKKVMTPQRISFLNTRAFKNGFLFVTSGQGIFYVKKDSLVAQQVLATTADIWQLIVANDQYLFLIGSRPLGRAVFSYQNNKWMKVSHPFDSIEWSNLYYNEKDRTYWVWKHTELLHYDSNFKKIRSYLEKDGLPPNSWQTITSDNSGNIWLATPTGVIAQLNVQTGQITTLSDKDGYQRNFLDFSCPFLKDINGHLYFSGSEGIDRISPGKFKSSSSSAVYFQSLEVNQKPASLSAGINNVQQLSLKYFQNKISIATGIIDFYSKGKSRIRYKLEKNGEAGDWEYAPDYYTIRYEGLQPGKYRLVIQASNSTNEFNGPAKVLQIIISPPFWQTWWFRTLVVIGVIVLIYSFLQYRSRNLKKRNVELEEKVMHRTKELKHSLEELRQTQAQLIQSEKMASLGELTAGIAHEIQNPLNFVNNFSEVNAELIDELESERSKVKGERNEALEHEIINDIKQNLEKINHHGKRADAIVKGMLQHSRISSGQKEITDINGLVDEYLRLSYHGLRAKDKTFNAQFDASLDPSVGKINVVPQDIGRVILNLLNNAFYAVSAKASAAAGSNYAPLVTVSTKKLDDKIEITVSDNGDGIPKSIIDKIFQPFFTMKPTGQGTGLGLSLAYDVVKAHGGEIKVRTEEGKGSEFLIVLPA
jgi:signal transduction histidine kinase